MEFRSERKPKRPFIGTGQAKIPTMYAEDTVEKFSKIQKVVKIMLLSKMFAAVLQQGPRRGAQFGEPPIIGLKRGMCLKVPPVIKVPF